MSCADNERAKMTGSLLRPGSFLLATLATLGLSAAGCSSSSPSTSHTPTTSAPTTSAPTTSASAAALATAPVGANPQWDDLDPITDTIYVANGGTGAATGNTVSVINRRHHATRLLSSRTGQGRNRATSGCGRPEHQHHLHRQPHHQRARWCPVETGDRVGHQWSPV